jgi:hypothetical protein
MTYKPKLGGSRTVEAELYDGSDESIARIDALIGVAPARQPDESIVLDLYFLNVRVRVGQYVVRDMEGKPHAVPGAYFAGNYVEA